MKNFTKNHFKLSSVVILLMLTLLNACKKEDTVDTSIAYFRVTNASPTLSTYNVYLNGTQINPSALPFAGSVAYNARSTGSYNLKFTSASSTTTLLSKDFSINASTYNTIYLINKTNALDIFTAVDDLSVTSATKAYIRFINLSPDASAMDLVNTGTTNTTLFTGKTYKTATGFLAIDGGVYSLDAKETTGGAVRTSLSAFTFTAGYHYDIIYGGLIAPANDTERPVNLQAILIK
ncbi:DUF4397 domain-containing protein [Pedobacter mucosus]|uniref:DUF4397 domain-containing protein n=1 Tax=Pedobacter mucosus TaxID=2895286 RepID=UPI001EE3A7B1|nr:DUF4397 domain-containing protein [Pedobacter mucosus]UKT63904.1 DUF4397 domain-containing protein [Pedobacter mucosus]